MPELAALAAAPTVAAAASLNPGRVCRRGHGQQRFPIVRLPPVGHAGHLLLEHRERALCDPDDRPLFYLSEHGRDALEAENASGQAAAPDNDEAASSGAGADPAETTAHQTAVSLALTTLELIV